MLVTFYIQVMQMILHVRVRVRRVFPDGFFVNVFLGLEKVCSYGSDYFCELVFCFGLINIFFYETFLCEAHLMFWTD